MNQPFMVHLHLIKSSVARRLILIGYMGLIRMMIVLLIKSIYKEELLTVFIGVYPWYVSMSESPLNIIPILVSSLVYGGDDPVCHLSNKKYGIVTIMTLITMSCLVMDVITLYNDWVVKKQGIVYFICISFLYTNCCISFVIQTRLYKMINDINLFYSSYKVQFNNKGDNDDNDIHPMMMSAAVA